MRISVLCSNKAHPVFETLSLWQKKHESKHKIELVQSRHELSGGDILFLISCSELIQIEVRNRYKATLVLHASNLPIGRGWSPHIWQIIEGNSKITVSLLNAEDKVDSGSIWAQREILLEGHELYNEINSKLFVLESDLMDFAVDNFENISPVPQLDVEPTYYRKRTPEDSSIDPDKSISEQFNLLRVADPERFPAYFDLHNHRYLIKLEKVNTPEA